MELSICLGILGAKVVSMDNASFIGQGFHDDNIFDLDSNMDCDSRRMPYIRLREFFIKHNIKLHTEDMCEKTPLFQLHFNVVTQNKPSVPAYLLLMENNHIYPSNAKPPKYYRKIFTWRDDLVDGNRIVKMYLPNTIRNSPVDCLTKRDRFCCMISGNKTVKIPDGRELYSERIKIIKWFEKNAPHDFELFGTGWNCPPLAKIGRESKLSKLQLRFWHFIESNNHIYTFFPSYRGKVKSKRQILLNTKYSICFENVRDYPGYITEKIFDSFFAGCVPVYWGASNISDYIPDECYIDFRKFSSINELYTYLKSINKKLYNEYQYSIASFLSSSHAYPFSEEFFARNIVNNIIDDLGA